MDEAKITEKQQLEHSELEQVNGGTWHSLGGIFNDDDPEQGVEVIRAELDF